MSTATAAIAGAAQVVQRPGDWSDPIDARGPIELMVDAARAAADDAGAPGLLERVGWIGVAGGFWRYANPGRVVGQRIGVPDAGTALTPISGSAPQELIGLAAERITRGELDVALVLGGEARWTQQRLKRDGEEPRWTTDPGGGTPEAVSGLPDEMLREARTLGGAPPVYALFEDSLRTARGESIDEHRDRIAALWAAFSAVAAQHPWSWDREAKTAAQIREPSPDNRMIAFPYTKAMVANNTVDMASAILLCSVDAAAAAGAATDCLVFPHVVTSSHETWQVVNRHELHGAPALTVAGHAALAHAGVAAHDIEHVDLYACFPAVVQMSAAALGLDPDRPLTVTGGLGFAGAPIGNAAGQSIAAMVPRVRDGGFGLVHANGGNATKHSFGLYSDRPPAQYARIDCQASVRDEPRAAFCDDFEGAVRVEAATVVFDREGPSHVLAAVRDAAGARGWATTEDPQLIADAMKTGLAGAAARRTAPGTLG